MTTRYPTQSQLITPTSHPHFSTVPFTQHEEQINHPNQFQTNIYNNRAGLALGPPQPSPSFQQGASSLHHANINPFEDWPTNQEKGSSDFLSEEEIRVRSHEILENEDMQHLLRLFSMGGGHGSGNVPEDGFGFPPYTPTPSPGFGYSEDRARSGKAVVGWLKIKAAMRWGIFIRKKAAERRAQIEEIEDDDE